MRKLLLGVVLFLPLITFSQNFKGGLLGGLAATQVDGDGYGGYHRAGAIGGVWVSFPLATNWTLRTELKVIQKGSYKRHTDGAGGTAGTYSLSLSYAEMPFLVEYSYNEKITPFAGLSGGYLWKAMEKNNGLENLSTSGMPFKKVELAAHAGVDYRLNSHFSFCGTFSYSVLPVRNHSGNAIYLWHMNFGQFNNVVQFYVRYHF